VRLLLVVLVLAGCTPAKKSEAPRGKVSAEIADKGPRLVGNPPTVQIELPPRMTAALAESDSGYATLTPFDFVKEVVPGETTDGGWRYPYDGRQAPFAVIGDFDGDGRDDVALLQRSKDGPGIERPAARVVFVFDRAARARAEHAYSLRYFDLSPGAKTGFYLTRFPAGPFRIPDFGGSGDTARTVTFPNESVELSNYGKTAGAIGWVGEGFEFVQTGD